MGHSDVLTGFRLENLKITDADVLAKSEQEYHPIAIPGDSTDQISGTLFEITASELQQADAYEVSDYKRIQATFSSGRQGWVYVKA